MSHKAQYSSAHSHDVAAAATNDNDDTKQRTRTGLTDPACARRTVVGHATAREELPCTCLHSFIDTKHQLTHVPSLYRNPGVCLTFFPKVHK